MKKYLVLFFGLFINFLTSQIVIDDSNFREIILKKDNRLKIIDYTAKWCEPCQRMKPMLRKFNLKYKGNTDFYQIDFDANAIPDTLEINLLPSFQFVYNKKLVGMIKGYRSRRKFKDYLDSVLDKVFLQNMEDNYLDLFDLAKHGSKNEFSEKALSLIKDNYAELNNLAFHAFTDHFEEKEIIIRALNIVLRSLEIDRNYYNLDTYASLLYANKEYDKSKVIANEAIKLGEKDKINVAATKDLMKKINSKL